MSTTQNAQKFINLKIKAFLILFLFMFMLFFVFWGISGDIAYWEAWIYMTVFSIYEIFVIRFLLRYDPELINQRLIFREKSITQQMVIVFGGFNYLLMYSLPAIDHRYGWSAMAYWIKIVGYIILGFGMIMAYNVLKINRWASRTIQVQKGQNVISTGLYGIIRHPFYLAGWLASIGTPLVLGSYWGLIGAFSWLVMLIVRLLNEEKMLQRDLPGYEDYCTKVKYRLIPGIF